MGLEPLFVQGFVQSAKAGLKPCCVRNHLFPELVSRIFTEVCPARRSVQKCNPNMQATSERARQTIRDQDTGPANKTQNSCKTHSALCNVVRLPTSDCTFSARSDLTLHTMLYTIGS